jgi:hypothetical protein
MPDPIAQLDSALAALNTATVAVAQARDIVVGSTTFDLSDQLDKSKSDVSLYATAKYVQSRPFALRALSNWSLAGNGATVHYTGPRTMWMFDWQGPCDSIAIDGLKLINDGASKDGTKTTTAFHPAGSNLKLTNISADGFDCTINAEQLPNDCLFQNLRNTNAQGFLIFGGGLRWTMDGLWSDDGWDESNLRFDGLHGFTLTNSIVNNLDCRPIGQVGNYAKTASRFEDCSDGVIDNCTFGLYVVQPDGSRLPTGANPVTFGPLSGADAVQQKIGAQRCRNIVARNCRANGPVRIGNGAENITLANWDVQWADGMYAAFSVDGFDAALNRTVDGLVLANNLVISTVGRALFLRQSAAGTKNVTVTGNGMVCPNWKIDEGYGGSMIAMTGERGPFAFKGNHWPVPTWGYVSNPREVAVFGTESRNPEQWAAETGDTFAPTDEATLRAAGIGVRP